VYKAKTLLYPNPNDGNFILQQMIADNKLVDVEIWDVVGRSIYKEEQQFVTDKIQLQMGKVPAGIYMLEVMDNSYRKFRFKFVVE